MKKLIVLSVVFALMVGSVFAVDLGGTVFGKMNVIEGSSAANADIVTNGGNGRARLDGAGEAGDGAFGGYIRLDGGSLDAWWAYWKPIDQFKLIIGKNADGQWGKENITGWGFNGMPNDGGVAVNFGIWGAGDFYGAVIKNRYFFFNNWNGESAMLEITPADMFSVNIGIPFNKAKTEETFKALLAQVNVNLDIGNIAITYDGSDTYLGSKGAIFASFLGTIGDLGLDVGFSYHIADGDALPIGIGAGVKYATDSFGVKFRVVTALAGAGQNKGTYINASVLPYFSISENLAAYVNAGLAVGIPDAGDAELGWYVNPYLRVGAEWGAQFLAGVKLYASDTDKSVTKFAIPIAIMLSF